MRILAIDTSGEQASAAILQAAPTPMGGLGGHPPTQTVGEILLNARTGENSWTHSEILMPGIEQLFHLTRLEPACIDYIAYTNGPGSFTGLRIGASCALAMAHALNIPAIPVPTLDALARNLSNPAATIVPLLDARRAQVYAAVYKNNQRQTDYLALPIEELLPTLPTEKIIFLGCGADANKAQILQAMPNAAFAPANNNRQRAASAALCALEKIQNNTADFTKNVEIIYVRQPQAVRAMTAKENCHV